MKYILPMMMATVVLFAACGGGEEAPAETPTEESTSNEDAPAEGEPEIAGTEEFGDKLDYEGVQPLAELDLASMMEGKDALELKLAAEVSNVCKVKGCWMKLMAADSNEIRVSFKDYGFFVPMDITGSQVVIDGVMTRDTTSIEDLQHYAEDEGLSQEEIDAITEPEINFAFEANGVILNRN